jgi:predicted ATPase
VELHTQRQHELGPHAGQVILTTHSPYLVDRMNLADMIVVEKKEGATRLQDRHPKVISGSFWNMRNLG